MSLDQQCSWHCTRWRALMCMCAADRRTTVGRSAVACLSFQLSTRRDPLKLPHAHALTRSAPTCTNITSQHCARRSDCSHAHHNCVRTPARTRQPRVDTHNAHLTQSFPHLSPHTLLTCAPQLRAHASTHTTTQSGHTKCSPHSIISSLVSSHPSHMRTTTACARQHAHDNPEWTHTMLTSLNHFLTCLLTPFSLAHPVARSNTLLSLAQVPQCRQFDRTRLQCARHVVWLARRLCSARLRGPRSRTTTRTPTRIMTVSPTTTTTCSLYTTP
jgi:hypothetical protein